MLLRKIPWLGLVKNRDCLVMLYIQRNTCDVLDVSDSTDARLRAQQ